MKFNILIILINFNLLNFILREMLISALIIHFKDLKYIKFLFKFFKKVFSLITIIRIILNISHQYKSSLTIFKLLILIFLICYLFNLKNI